MSLNLDNFVMPYYYVDACGVKSTDIRLVVLTLFLSPFAVRIPSAVIILCLGIDTLRPILKKTTFVLL